MRLLITVVLTLLLITACAAVGLEDPPPSFEDIQWQLTSGTVDGQELNPPDTHPITVLFTDGRVSGTASCNGYGGEYAVDGADVEIGLLAMTEMACSPPETMEAESLYGSALPRVTQVATAGDEMFLSGDGVDLAFEALPPVPDAELRNTVWVLESLIRGDAVSSVADERATLEFFSDGSVLGDTGCRGFGGSYEIAGSEILIGDLGSDGHQCEPPLAEQDSRVLSVLEGPMRADIAADRLILTIAGGDGLVYRAEG